MCGGDEVVCVGCIANEVTSMYGLLVMRWHVWVYW